LAAGVAHEINNPLAYVLLNIQYVSDELADILTDRADDRTRELRLSLDHARSGAERIRDIVRGLKTFSRPDNDTRQSLDVIRVLDATLAMVHNEIRHRARLVKNYEQVPNVFANEARLGQVFLNLLMNAVQSLPEERASSNDIRVVVKASGVERVVIEVSDNGVGIPTQVRGRIFEPFFTTKPVGIGTGLGLAICHGIVTSLGGTLGFESEVGLGTTFRVDLPVVQESTAAAAIGRAEAREDSTPAVSGGVRRVRSLIVDDEPSVCFALERLLSKDSEVVAMTRARDALACIEAGDRFDVLFCDLMLPEMDGQALHEKLMVIDPTQAERMVFVTGGVFTARARDFLASVPNRRLGKPFDIDTLLAIVRERAGR
jgi:CheY-like chemotaxis protein